jgi:TP901 family phage tail tape measure protein
LSLGGLQTTANVNIKVGVQRQTSFMQFEQRLNAIKAALNEISTMGGMGAGQRGSAAAGTTVRGRRVNPMDDAVRQFRADQAQAVRDAKSLARQPRPMDEAVKQFRADQRALAAWSKAAGKQPNPMDAAVQQFRADQAQAVRDARALSKQKNPMDVAVAQFRADQSAWAKQQREAVAANKLAIRASTGYAGAGDNAVRNFYEGQAATQNAQTQQALLSRMSQVPKGVDKRRWNENIRGLRDYVSQMDPAIASTGKFIAATQKFNSIQADEEYHVQRMKTDMAYRLDQTEKRLDAFFRAAFRLQMVGQSLRMMGRNIINAFSGIMTTFGDFQFMLNRAGAALSIFGEEGSVGISKLQTSVIDLAQSVKLIPTKDVAQALYFWASATGQVIKSDEDLARNMKALEPIMQAATMTNTDYETTIKGVYSIITQFYHGDISYAADITTRLYEATQATALEFQDLINSFKMIGPIAAANNVSFEEMVSLFGQLGDLGIRGTMAGRALRQLLIKVSKPTPEATTALNNAFGGAEQNKAATFQDGKFVGIRQYIKNLAEATKDWESSRRNSLIATITTANELPAVIALVTSQIRVIKGLNTETTKYVTTQEQANETFRKSWKQLGSTWNAVVGSVQRAWEGLQIQIGSSLAEVLSPLMEQLGGIVKSLREWARVNPQVVKFIGQLAAMAAVLTTVAGIAFTIVGSVLAFGTAVTLVWKVVQPVIGKVLGFIGIIGGLFIALIKNIDYVSDQFNRAFKIISNSFEQNREAANDFGEVFADVGRIVSDIFGIIIRMLADLTVHFAHAIDLLMTLNKVIPILDAIKTAIIAIVAYKTISSLYSMIAGFTGLTRALAIARTEAGVGLPIMQQISNKITGIGAATKKAITGIGLLGWAFVAVSLGIAANETNFLGFGDFIDSITDKFRDLKKELKEVSDAWGPDLAGSISMSSEKIANTLLDMNSIVASIKKTPTNKVDPFTVWGPESDKKNLDAYSVNILGRMLASVNKEALTDKIENEIIPEYKVALVKAWNDALNGLNFNLSANGVDLVSQADFNKTLVGMLPKIDWDTVLKSKENVDMVNAGTFTGWVVRMLYEQIAATGTSPTDIKTIAAALEKKFGPIFIGGAEQFVKDNINSGAFAQAITGNIWIKQNAFFQPMVDKINKMLDDETMNGTTGIDSSGLTTAIQAKLVEMLNTSVGGKESLSELLGQQNISPLLKDQIQKFLDLLSQDAIDAVGASGTEDGTSVIQKYLESFTAAIDAILSAPGKLKELLKKGGDKTQLGNALKVLTSGAYANARGNKSNTGARLAAESVLVDAQSAVSDFIKLHPGVSYDNLSAFINTILPSSAKGMHLTKKQRKAMKDARKAIMREIHDIFFPKKEETVTAPAGGPGGESVPASQLAGQIQLPEVAVPQGLIDTKTILGSLPQIATGVGAGVMTNFGTSIDNNKGVAQTSGRQIGIAWANNLRSGVLNGISQTRDGVRGYLTSGNMVTFKSEHQKKILVTVDIKSSDGTANRLTQSQIREGTIRAFVDGAGHLEQLG